MDDPTAADTTLVGARGKGSTKRLLKQYNTYSSLPPTLVLDPVDGFTLAKTLDLFDRIKIGRQTSSKTAPSATNGFFDSKVLSRNHAEVWAETNKVLIKDTGSSNGTFVNGQRLSAENQESSPVELHGGDAIEFGIDILDENGVDVLYRKVVVTANFVDANKKKAAAAAGTVQPGVKRGMSNDSVTTIKSDPPSTFKATLKDQVRAAPSRPEGNRELQNAVSSLQTHLAKAKEQAVEVDSLGEQVSGMTQVVGQYQNRQAIATNELTELKSQLKVLQDRVNTTQTRNNSLTTKVERLSAQIVELEQENETMQKHTLAPLRKEKQDLFSQNEMLTERVALLDTDNKQLEKLRSDIKALQTEKQILEKRLSNKQKSQSRYFFLLAALVFTASFYRYIYYMNGWSQIESFAQNQLGVDTNHFTENVNRFVIDIKNRVVDYGIQLTSITTTTSSSDSSTDNYGTNGDSSRKMNKNPKVTRDQLKQERTTTRPRNPRVVV